MDHQSSKDLPALWIHGTAALWLCSCSQDTSLGLAEDDHPWAGSMLCPRAPRPQPRAVLCFLCQFHENLLEAPAAPPEPQNTPSTGFSLPTVLQLGTHCCPLLTRGAELLSSTAGMAFCSTSLPPNWNSRKEQHTSMEEQAQKRKQPISAHLLTIPTPIRPRYRTL